MRKELIITKQLKAPKTLVFDAFSKAEHLKHWWGPANTNIEILKFDFTEKGIFHYKMEANSMAMYGRFIYGKIVRPELIEFVVSFSDESGGIARAPFSPVWPLEVFNSMTLEEEGDMTTLRIVGYPINATEEETAAYDSNHANMQAGFEGTFKQLEEYLEKM